MMFSILLFAVFSAASSFRLSSVKLNKLTQLLVQQTDGPNRIPVLDHNKFKFSITKGVTEGDNKLAIKRLIKSSISEIDHLQRTELSSSSSLVTSLFSLFTALDWLSVMATATPTEQFSSAPVLDTCIFGYNFAVEFNKLQKEYIRVLNTTSGEASIIKPHHLWAAAKHRQLLEIKTVGSFGGFAVGVQLGELVFCKEDLEEFECKALALIDML